jgi:membrane-bound metal-dependent hydrolase YbcI (DUF457 family)
MCEGYTHALSGLCTGLAAGILTHRSLPADAALSGLTAGMALIPDLDSVGACASRSLGYLSKAVAYVIRLISFGHRHGTHSIPGIAVFTGLAVLACHFRRDYAGMAGLALLLTIAVAGAVEALRLTKGHAGDLLGIGVSALVIWQGYGLSLIPLAVVVGTFTHLAADSCTDSGVMWFWPVWGYRIHFLPEPLAWSTGTEPETRFVVPVLFAALAVLAVQAADPGLVVSGWHHMLALAR